MTLDATLARAATTEFSEYDPRAVIDAVNALVPLGKTGALAAIEKAAAANDENRGLFLVLRALFDIDVHPTLKLGAPTPPPPANLGGAPRYPILLVDDVPILLVTGYALAGMAEPLSAHVDYYRSHGTLRAAPLAPPAKLDRAKVRQAYQAAYGAPPPAEIAAQLDRAKL